MRINKYLAARGLASRREADRLIAAGQVLINGTPAEMGQRVSENDSVELTGHTPQKRYLAYYKPRGVITHSPAAHETDIATKLQQDYGVSGVYPIGRLDKDSEGLILLTDDGRITGPLLDPNADHPKTYAVRVDKPVNNWVEKHLENGVDIEGYVTKPARVTRDPKHPKRLEITITEGKKHQIRRMCAALGLQVQDLTRTHFATVALGALKPNQYRKLSTAEVADLLAACGLSTTKQ